MRARGGISAICPQEPSIGIRPVVAQARRKLGHEDDEADDARRDARH